MTAIDPRLGSLLDRRYRVLARVGEGGAGVVYRALHEEITTTGERMLSKLASRRAEVTS